MQERTMDCIRKPLAIIAFVALGACVSPSANGVLRTGSALPRHALMVMVAQSAPRSAIQTSVHKAAQVALQRLGYQFGSVGDFAVDTAYSERPLGVSFETDGGLHSAVAKLPNLAICTHRIQRLTLVVTDQRTGRPVYQGQAEITQCANTSADNATRLADAAVAKLQPALVAP